MTANPARIFNLEGGTLAEGTVADLTIIDPDKKWTVNAKNFRSRSTNSPFVGYKLSGKVVKTVLGGRVVYDG
jgi:dihydroorotase